MVLASFGIGLVLAFTVWWLAGWIATQDVFGTHGATRDLDRLPASIVRSLKLAHGLSHPPYEVAVFGNSRMISLSAADIGIERERYFNFSVPGTSIRNSIAMLEVLAKAERLPRRSIIGLDNLYLEYFENTEADLPERLVRTGTDLSDVLTGSVPLRDGLKILWRHALKTWTTFETWLTFSAFPGRRAVPGDRPVTYREDGSRAQLNGGRPVSLNVPAGRRAVVVPVLASDLRRIKQLSLRHGARIVVVELPLHHAARTTGGRADVLRSAFLSECRTLDLECHSIRGDEKPLASAPWPDATHAPTAALGHVIAGFLAAGSATR